MAQVPESGVLIIETGYRCPDLTAVNFLPFAPEQDTSNLINLSGGFGPIKPSIVNAKQLSGILGAGTLFPGSGTIEQLSRLFWCVKSWTLEINALVYAPGNECFVQDVNFVNLNLLDIFASGILPANNLPISNAGNQAALSAEAVPIDSIMKWEELICRDKYFCWCPPQLLQTGFALLNFNNFNNTPFINTWSMQMTDDGSDELPPNAYGIWNLAIMNSDFLCRQGASILPTGQLPCFTPTGMDDVDLNSYSLAPQINSGALLDYTGQITGYGYVPVLSGFPPVLAYRPTYDKTDPDISGRDPNLFNPTNNCEYFPMIYFDYRMINGPLGQTVECAMNVRASTIQPGPGYSTAGSFSILDSNITGYSNNQSLITQRELFSCPLYCPASESSQISLTVTMTPLAYWINTDGTVNY